MGAPTLLFIAHFSLLSSALAHNPDTSYLRLEVTDKATSIRLSYDIITLLAVVPGLDADGDKSVSKEELTAADPAIRQYLREKVSVAADNSEPSLGQALPLIWPEDRPEAIPQVDYHQVVFHFPFRLEQAPPDLIAIDFAVFPEFGERHMILSQLAYLDFKEEIFFDLAEPDYDLDLAYIRAEEAKKEIKRKTEEEPRTKKPASKGTNLWVIVILVLAPVWFILMRKAKKGGDPFKL